MAYPVVAPKDNPIAITKPPTTNGFKPSENLLEPIAKIPNNNINDPIISLTRLDHLLRIAGIVEKTANCLRGSFVSFQWGK